MTTIVGVCKAGEVVIAGDSQSTFGDTRLSAGYDAAWDKIFAFGDAYVGICGSAAHDLVLQGALAGDKHAKLGNRKDIFDTFRRLHPKLKEEYFLNPQEDEDDPYESNHMSILIANPHGLFGVFSMREVYRYTRIWAIGSGREYAIGAMHAVYDQLDSAAEIAAVGMNAGCTFDVNSSAPYSLYRTALLEPTPGTL